MTNRKINALIELLDDPDLTVFELVEKELLKETDKIIPKLEQKWESSFDVFCQERIENIIQNLQFKQTTRLLKQWLKESQEERDLFTGFLIIDRFQYPDVNPLNIRLKLENIRKKIWLELNNSLTLLEKITILNHFLFNLNEFSINFKNIHSPQNCFLNQMLDTKKGNPVSISIFYTIVARMLDLPAQFIDFPKNPLVAIVDAKLARKVHGNDVKSDVLFYINPSNKGSITSIKEIEYHLRTNNYFPLQHYTEPKSDVAFIKLLVESLELSYQSVNFMDKKERVKQLLRLF
ncbi:MAG TPA: transglutaminase family protein [Draconibacterium sp.]|nr:transglutaminase family protein [Draconibacterium sp.]HRX10499.1 transglutaminase family protein [Draconibacterium sp.]